MEDAAPILERAEVGEQIDAELGVALLAVVVTLPHARHARDEIPAERLEGIPAEVFEGKSLRARDDRRLNSCHHRFPSVRQSPVSSRTHDVPLYSPQSSMPRAGTAVG